MLLSILQVLNKCPLFGGLCEIFYFFRNYIKIIYTKAVK